MPADGTEFVSLAQLKDYDDNRVTSGLDAKLNAPASDGTNGQMLVYGSSGNQWTDVPESVAYSADDETLQLSGTQFSVKDGGISAAKIANGTVTADKLASGIIPDVSEFITAADANEAYAAKSHTHAASQVTGLIASRALVSDTSGHPSASTVTSTELGYLGGVTSAIQTQLNGKAATSHTHANATTSADGFMSSEDKTKLDGLQGQIDETKRLRPVNEISAGTDLDTLTEPGSWFCDEASGVTNAPERATGAFALYVYSVSGGGLIQELVSSSGRSWTRAVPGEWLEMTGPSMESYGEVLWNGRITEGGTLVIPDANRYGVMAVSYSSHAPLGLAMHFITVNGLHEISGMAGASSTNGLSIRGFEFSSNDGVTWTAKDLEILSLWGSGTSVDGQWHDEKNSNTLTIWGIVPSQVTQRVA